MPPPKGRKGKVESELFLRFERGISEIRDETIYDLNCRAKIRQPHINKRRQFPFNCKTG